MSLVGHVSEISFLNGPYKILVVSSVTPTDLVSPTLVRPHQPSPTDPYCRVSCLGPSDKILEIKNKTNSTFQLPPKSSFLTVLYRI